MAKARKPRLTTFTDTDTGQTSHAYLADKPDEPKVRSGFEGVFFMMTGIQTYRVFRQLKMPGSARVVMDWLCEHAEDGNKVYKYTHELIARECGLTRYRVTEMINKLEDAKLILRLAPRGATALNPRYWYMDKLEFQPAACAQWDRWQGERLSEQLSIMPGAKQA